MTDMGPLHHFLGFTVERRDDNLFLSQLQYMLDILDRAGMRACKSCSTPVDTHSKLLADGVSIAVLLTIAVLLELFSISPSPARILHT